MDFYAYTSNTDSGPNECYHRHLKLCHHLGSLSSTDLDCANRFVLKYIIIL